MLTGLIISLLQHIQLTLPGTVNICSTAYQGCLPDCGWKPLFSPLATWEQAEGQTPGRKKRRLLHITVSIFLPFPVLPSFITYSAFQNARVCWLQKRNNFINFNLFSKASSPHTYPEIIPHPDSPSRNLLYWHFENKWRHTAFFFFLFFFTFLFVLDRSKKIYSLKNIETKIQNL